MSDQVISPVYFVNKVGVTFCLDLETGAGIWRERIGGECLAMPLAAGDRIYFFTNTDVTTVMRDGVKPKTITSNVLSDVERIYGIAAVDSALLLRSGRRIIKVSQLELNGTKIPFQAGAGPKPRIISRTTY
jgi:outer membrane protein assembly factor BamB